MTVVSANYIRRRFVPLQFLWAIFSVWRARVISAGAPVLFTPSLCIIYNHDGLRMRYRLSALPFGL